MGIDWGTTNLNREQVAQVAYNAGFRGQTLIDMVGIAFRESGGHAGLYVDRPETGDWSYGLWGLNIGKNRSLWKEYQAMGFTDPAQLRTPEGNAKAAFLLYQKYGENPWGPYKGQKYTYGTDLNKAKAAVDNAASQGLLGKDYSGPGSGGQSGQSGSMDAATERKTFQDYLSSQGSQKAQQIIDDIKQPRDLAGVSQYMQGASPEVNRYINFLSTLDTGAQTNEKAALSAGTSLASGGGENADLARKKFSDYLSTLSAEDQQRTIDELKTPRDMAGVSQYMASAPPEVNEYIKYLSTLDNFGQTQEKNLLSAAPDPGATNEMTNLLNTFGVSYPNAPKATPALLAFLKGIGLNLSTAEDVQRRAIERIGASTSDAMADIDRTAGRTKQNVTADLVRRGVLSSGESNTRYARQEEDVASSKSDVQRASATATESVTDAYTQSRDLARQQALDKIIGAEQQQATDKATSQASVDSYNAQQSASDAAWQRQQQSQNDSIAKQEELMAKYAQQGVVV